MTSSPLDPLGMAGFGVYSAVAQHPLSKDVRDGAYPVTPDVLRRLVAAEDELSVQADRFAAPAETYAGFLARAADDLIAGDPDPDLAAAAQVVIDDEATRQRGARTIAQLRDAVQGRWPEALREHVDEMLAGLRAPLAGLLADVESAAGAIEGLDLTDGEAIAVASESQLAAIGRLKALRPQYRRLRHLQENLLKHTFEDPPAGWGHLTWLSVFRTRAHEFGDLPGNGLPAEDLPTLQWFRRLLHRDDVWMPALDELGAALRPSYAPRSAHADPDPGHQAALREREGKTRTFVALHGLNR